MINKRQKVSIENTRFIFTTNFSGDPSRDRFGSNKRRVNLVLTEDMAHHLMDMGVTVKQTRPNPEKTYDESFLPTYFVPVNVNMESKWPPHDYWVTTTGKKLLCDIDMVGQLDYIRVKNVNCLCNLVEKRNNPGEFSLYADVMYVEQDVDLGYIIPSTDLNINIVVARANGKSLSQLEMVDSLMKRRFNYENR